MHKNFLKISLVLATFFSFLSPMQAHGSVDYFYEDPTDVTRKHATATEFVTTLFQDAPSLIHAVYGGLRPKQRDSLFRDKSFHDFLNAMPEYHRNNFILLMNRDEKDETKLQHALSIPNLMAYSTFQRVFNEQELVNQAYADAEQSLLELEAQQHAPFLQTLCEGTEDLARHAIRVWIKGAWSYNRQLPTLTDQWAQNFLAPLLGDHDAALGERPTVLEKLEYAITTLRQRFIECRQPLDNLTQGTATNTQIRKVLGRSSLLYLEMITTLRDVYFDTELAPEEKAQKFNGVHIECDSLSKAILAIMVTLTQGAQQAQGAQQPTQ